MRKAEAERLKAEETPVFTQLKSPPPRAAMNRAQSRNARSLLPPAARAACRRGWSRSRGASSAGLGRRRRFRRVPILTGRN